MSGDHSETFEKRKNFIRDKIWKNFPEKPMKKIKIAIAVV
jgi:hypothetical protein